ncbi:MAG: hypothetical protein ACYTGC_17730, partial [Planctomycetota bacterium]
GRPLVEVLRRAGDWKLESGRRFRSRARILGMPAIHIALGPKEGELQGKARGFIAIGDDAQGVVAIGGTARGIVAVGGGAFGVFSIGGFSVGLLTAMGGGAISTGIALGGGAVGTIAKGGGALGIIADGGGACGIFARGAGAFGRYALGRNPGANSTEASDLFDRLSWLLGPGLSLQGYLQTFGIVLLVTLAIGGVLAYLGWSVHQREPASEATE